jgi:hypothetical protein
VTDHSYRPRRARARWLEGAPSALLAVYDNGGKSFDRYTALYGAPLWVPSMAHTIPARFMSSDPFHPQGVGMYGEVKAYYRDSFGKKVRFLDLPDAVKRCIIRDCTTDNEP